ncbi:nucleotidyl transferase AbiEii/AbiGii toxin family protein [Pararhizobium sp. DWP1-1-3]|uniref:nucleotidyl transferase AbiEii/AbiGii toxin family protein n=1 Tax=Pararhizobium sp. DWP1-1-3 TaxID=2804652 RepID=UPI003CFBA963
MITFIPHLETLPIEQQAIWPLLRPAAGLGLVLYGGTAIALRLGHRQSIDFDFFTEHFLDFDALYDAMPFLRPATVIQQEPSTLTVLATSADSPGSPVKISFFGPVRTGRLGTPQFTDDGVLLVASLDDVFATKVKVLLQRVEVKDYRDIAAMIRDGRDLANALGGARALYGASFQPSESLKALTYFEGGDLHQLSRQDRLTLVDAVKAVRNIPSVDIIGNSLAIGVRV